MDKLNAFPAKQIFSYLFAVLLLQITMPSAWAQDNQGIGLHAAPFLRINPSARAVAMGEAYSAVDDEITSLHYNPANIGALNKSMLALHFHNWIGDTKQGAIGLALPTKLGVFGFDFTYFSEGEIVELDENFFRTGGTSGSDDILLTLAYANMFVFKTGQLRFGLAAKVIRQNLIGEQSSAAGLDIGLHYRYRFISLAASMQNVGLSKVKFQKSAASLPRTIRLGSAFFFTVQNVVAANLALDAATTADEKWRFYSGAECIISDLFVLRGGYKIHTVDATRWSAGFGLYMPAEWLAGARMRLDYAYAPFEAFEEASNRFSLVFKFGVAKKVTAPVQTDLHERLKRELAAAEAARLAAQEAEERTRKLEEEIANRLARIQQIAAESQGKIEVEPKSREKILVSMRINFDFDKANIRPEEFPTLHQVAEILDTYPEAQVQLSGHTDWIGTDVYNIRLSQRRIDSVMVYLINKENIPRQKFYMPVGYGESRPIADNKTDKGRFRNRRVEFLLYTLDATPELPDGSAIKAVEIVDESTARIICNGKVKFKWEMMDNPDRLVIDFDNIFLLNDIASYELDRGPFIRARLGYHESGKYSRVVFDLRRKINVKVHAEDNYVVIKVE
ncbi:PorV/PorQ family protein [candidate division KSB1 bacterium]|nr:PorV/PorQ family protein [candidate division KSB1 bacterium]